MGRWNGSLVIDKLHRDPVKMIAAVIQRQYWFLHGLILLKWIIRVVRPLLYRKGSVFSVKSLQDLPLFSCQLEVEDINVFFNARLCHGLGERNCAEFHLK